MTPKEIAYDYLINKGNQNPECIKKILDEYEKKLLGPSVREVFEKAFNAGQLDVEGIYVGFSFHGTHVLRPTIRSCKTWAWEEDGIQKGYFGWYRQHSSCTPLSPDYADRPATHLLGWWPEYDKAYEELRG